MTSISVERLGKKRIKFVPIDREITENDHVVDFRVIEDEEKLSIKHAISCFPSLLDCEYHHYMRDDLVPPAPGRYFLVEDNEDIIVLKQELG